MLRRWKLGEDGSIGADHCGYGDLEQAAKCCLCMGIESRIGKDDGSGKYGLWVLEIRRALGGKSVATGVMMRGPMTPPDSIRARRLEVLSKIVPVSTTMVKP